MMLLNYRFQIAAACFFVMIVLFYFKYKKLPLAVNKIFSIMLYIGAANIILDLITVYTLSHVASVPSFINRSFHQAFVLSLNAFMYVFFLYVYRQTHKNQVRNVKNVIIQSIPFYASVVFVFFGSIYYRVEGQKMYSYGIIPSTTYFIVTIYTIFIAYYLIKYRSVLSNEKVLAISGALIIEVVLGIVQIIFPVFLLSGLGVSLVFSFLYLSLENPRDNIEAEINLFNKHALTEVMEENFANKREFHVLIVALDDLATINFRFGQRFGNQLIKDMGDYISEKLGAQVFHPKGNALVVLMYANKQNVLKSIDDVQSCFDRNWTVNNVNTTFKLRMTLLSCPQYAESIDSVYDAIEFYVLNKNYSKEPVSYEIFDDEFVKAQKRYATIESMVSDAVSGDGFDVFYQPIFSTKHNSYITAEALIRLKDTKTLGFVSPEEFIPIAERKGLIIDLGIIVMEKVCQFAKNYDLKKLGLEYLEINLSGLQCMDTALSEKLRSIMDKYELQPSFFNFEITETVVSEKTDAITNNMVNLINMGSSFSMDDFGKGNSNLSKIADLPFELVKMDKSLVWAYFEENNAKGKVILPCSITMMNNLNMKIVAEGVETEEHKNILSDMGVDYLQGYYFSRPISGDALITMLTDFKEKNPVLAAV